MIVRSEDIRGGVMMMDEGEEGGLGGISIYEQLKD